MDTKEMSEAQAFLEDLKKQGFSSSVIDEKMIEKRNYFDYLKSIYSYIDKNKMQEFGLKAFVFECVRRSELARIAS